MIQNLATFFVALLIGFASCKPVDLSSPLTSEDYDVYSAYLSSLPFYKNVPSAETIIIADSTTDAANNIHPKTTWSWVIGNLGDRCKYLNDSVQCRKAQNPVWAPLFETVKKPSPTKQEFLLPSKFKVRYPIQLLSQFRKLSPDSQSNSGSLTYYIFQLSKIVYSADKTKALFFGSFICGGTCGRGELIMLEKIDNTWILIDTFRFWIA